MMDTAADGARFVGRRELRRAVLGLSISGALAASIGTAAATAAPITVGSPLATPAGQEPFGQSFTVINSALAEPGAHVTSPVDGTIVSWHIEGTGGPFYLQVLTSTGVNSYLGGARSAGEVPTSAATQTFSTDMPIKAGQLVALDNTNNSDTVGVEGVAGSAYSLFNPQVAPGLSGSTFLTQPNNELAFNAVVQPLPKVSSLRPRSETRKGGKKVTIKGRNFDGTTAVKFGSTQAKSFKVISDTKIVAVPRPHHSGKVHITVFNPGKSPASAASKFKFKKTG